MKKIAHKKNKKYQKLLLFLAISTLFWFLSKLNETYDHAIDYKISYKNLALDKIFKKEPKSQLSINLKANGYRFLSGKLTKKNIVLDLKYAQKLNNTTFYFLPNNHQNLFKEQLNFPTEINFIKPDTLFFEMDTLASKKVIVKPAIDYKFEAGYYLTEDLKLSPSSVLISGPKTMLDTINVLYTEDIILKKIKENFSKKLRLNTNGLEKLKFSTTEIKVEGKIEKFTEGKINIPITIIGSPKGKQIKTLPSSIDLTYKVSLTNFDKINKKDFKIICNYRDTERDSLPYLIPILKSYSSYVSDVKMKTNKIDFFIQ